jgi:K+-transporting ATPase ATPase A chain
MSYLTQMAGLAYHNFASAAVGMALASCVYSRHRAREKDTIGNFWVDMTRSTSVGVAAGCAWCTRCCLCRREWCRI